VVLTQITLSSGRPIELKKAFYKRIADNLQLGGIGLSSAQSGTLRPGYRLVVLVADEQR